MTQQEFDETSFVAGMRVTYRGNIYAVCCVSFCERLIGMSDDDGFNYEHDEDLTWARCENVELVK